MSKRWMIVGVLIVLGILVWRGFSTQQNAPTYETATVVRGTIEHVVSVTGHVEPVDRIALAFTLGGRVARINAREGQQVERGEVIALLDQEQLSADVQREQAKLLHERAVYAETVAPLSPERLAVHDATLRSAVDAEKNSIEDLRTALVSAYTAADTAIREQADVVFEGVAGNVPTFGVRFTYGSTDYFIRATASEESRLNEGRRNVQTSLSRMQKVVRDIPAAAGEELLHSAESTTAELILISTFLSDLASVVNSYIPDELDARTVYDDFRNSVATARSSLQSTLSSLRTARSKLDAAQRGRESAEQVHREALSGATAEERSIQEALVQVAEESVKSAVSNLDATVLRAPRTGVIAEVIPETGETVGAHTTVAILLTEGAYEIEVFIPEADIARVTIGDRARVTFDAFERSNVLEATVHRIALIETVREGVPTYKTTLTVDESLPEWARLLPGMTADVDISTDTLEGVLYVPTRSIVYEDGLTYVRTQNVRGDVIKTSVDIGLKGSNGTVEIIRGLADGESVILYEKQ